LSFLTRVQAFFTTNQETKENHDDPLLRSRYYKVNKQTALSSVQTVLSKQQGFSVSSVSEERGEISVHIKSRKKAFMVVTVVTVRPFETAIDFTVSTETPLPFDFGFSRQIIIELYKELDKNLPVIKK